MSNLAVECGNSVALNSDKSIFISSGFWEGRLKSLMFELTPCVYHQESQIYEATIQDLEYLKLRTKDMGVSLEIKEETFGNKKSDGDNDFNEIKKFEFKTKPFPHQIDAFEFGKMHPRFLLADEMGTGKTKTTIDIAVFNKIEYGYKHCLIICGVNGLKWNWETQIKIHSNEKSLILGNRKNSKGKWNVKSSEEKLYDSKNIPDDVYFIITNVETLRNEEIADALREQCENKNIQMILFDEFHLVANPNSQQSQGLLKLSAETMIAMTGSPIMNTPLDIYMTLRWLGYDRHEFEDFKKQFCRFNNFGEIAGFKHMDQIQNLLKVMMLRRLKSDVLDLPPKIRTVEYVEMGEKQSKIYNEVLNNIRDEVDLIAVSKNPLGNLIRLRQATAHTSIVSSIVSESAKIERLKQMVTDLVENNQKCIVFSNWTKVTDIIQEELKEYNPAIITGDTRERVEEENKFMQDPTCKCLIGTIAAAGTGLTLTAASTVFFVDEPFNASKKDQAEDRAHRIGAAGTVMIVTLIAKDSIDEKIHKLVEDRRFMSDTVIDNLDCDDINFLLNFLLS